MTKKDYCINNKPIAYYGICNTAGISIHDIEYGINDTVYFQFNILDGKTSYHKSKIYYSEEPYFKFGNIRIPLSECVHVL